VYLNCHSWFSLRYGTIRPEELLALCRDSGVEAAAFTDINNTSACLDFLRLAPKYGVRAVTGIDFRNGAQRCYVGIAKNNEGFRELNEHLSEHLHAGKPFGAEAPAFAHCVIIYPLRLLTQGIIRLHRLPEYAYIGVHSHERNLLRFSAAAHALHRCVILETVTFRNQRDFNIHRLLRTIDNNTLLSRLPKSEEGLRHHGMRPVHELMAEFSDFPELIANTRAVLDTCAVHFGFGEEVTPFNQRSYTGSEDGDYLLLKKLAEEGSAYRYGVPQHAGDPQHAPDNAPPHPSVVQSRLEKELSVIREKGFISYFLINWDITSYARSRGYFYVGRGSGANSLVAYLLRITDVDPIELDLYFERFINLYRKNPPDFDIDFSWTDREDITRYIFSRFPHVALVGAYSTFQYRAVVRELGKAFGLPVQEIDLLSDGRFDVTRLDETSLLVIRYSTLLQDFPNLISPHSCGILIADRPISNFTATLLPPKGFPTTHFDMIVAEDAGLYKFDILSQRGLGKIRDTLDMIRTAHPEADEIDIHDMRRFRNDARIRELLRTAKAIGCFYVESPAMRMLLTKLQVDDYPGLVAASSIIRPGVASSGMMKEYILRHRDPDRRRQAHPALLDIMPDTYGVMVYQEDVIKVAHFFAGLDLGEADSLRRGMSGKFRGREEFDMARQSFFEKARMRGHSEHDIAEIWRQTESFAGYAFAKGHSASYAVESFQSLFLKAWYPLEYMTATINNFGGFYSTELYVHEARMHGARIEPPCVNAGSAVAVLRGQTIILGFGIVRDLRHQVAEDLLRIRRERPFVSLHDFMDRVPVTLDQVSILIRVGAFRFTGRNKKEMLWEAHFRLGHIRKTQPVPGLFAEPARQFMLPPLHHSPIEDAYDEMELIGFPLCNPFDLLAEESADHVPARELPRHIGKTVCVTGYLIHVKPTKTSRGERMYFGTFLDRNGDFLDTVHFPPVASKFVWQGKGIYEVHGRVLEEFGALSVECAEMRKLPYTPDPRYAEERGARHAVTGGPSLPSSPPLIISRP
jgi:error-prone DNA polymerase